jgi:hypothetical protein
MARDAVSDFHKYLFYHELMRRNINPISKEDSCLPPDAVLKQPGRPKLNNYEFGQNVVDQKIQASFAAFVTPEDTINKPVLHGNK